MERTLVAGVGRGRRRSTLVQESRPRAAHTRSNQASHRATGPATQGQPPPQPRKQPLPRSQGQPASQPSQAGQFRAVQPSQPGRLPARWPRSQTAEPASQAAPATRMAQNAKDQAPRNTNCNSILFKESMISRRFSLENIELQLVLRGGPVLCILGRSGGWGCLAGRRPC